jgi:hypothetical protein
MIVFLARFSSYLDSQLRASAADVALLMPLSQLQRVPEAFGSGNRKKIVMQSSGTPSLLGALIILAVIGLAWYVVFTFSPSQPTATAAALASLAGVLAALPPIIRAFHGR